MISNPASVADLAALWHQGQHDHRDRRPRAGRWYDHEAGVGGDGLELIRHHKSLSDTEARSWARDWIGEIQHRPAPTVAAVSGNMDSKKTVAEIIARLEGIAGTPAETYLRSHGITITPPDCIRYRRFASGKYGALVALATDEAGVVLAVQQIYLTDDGRRYSCQPSLSPQPSCSGYERRNES